METTFKSSNYLANTGIVFGPYGGVGYYEVNFNTRKRAFKRLCICLRRNRLQDFFKKLALSLSAKKAVSC